MKGQQPDNQHNLLIAIVLSMIVMLGWQFFYAAPHIRQQQERALREKQEQLKAPGPDTAPSQTDSGIPPAPEAPVATSPVPIGTAALSRDEALAKSERIAIDTPSLKGSLALKGALIDDLVLKKYRVSVEADSPNVILFSPPGVQGAYFAEHGWKPSEAGIKVPDSETVWSPQGRAEKLTPSTPVTLTWDNGAGLVFKRTIGVDDNYLFTVTSEVENKSGDSVTLAPYARVYHFGTPKIEGFFILHEGLVGVPGDAGLQEITFADALEEGGESFEGKSGGWIGITEKYWGSALIPDQGTIYNASFRARQAEGARPEFYWVDYAIQAQLIPAGQNRSLTSRLYAGAKKAQVVESYEAEYGIEKFDLMIDWGWFYFITKPLNHLLTWLYEILGNFGLAILAVTVLVKLAFYPLANKSYVSMAKMKKLQPQMEQLRERFKDDKARQQQELMALYQKEKINPLAGCLPILIQIPVFFALYKVLFVSIDMRHAPFFGWIQDLSAPDPTSIVNLFGLLPFTVPDFLIIGAWPLIMGLTMWVQMQLNPPQPDPIQQQIFSWMPVLFTVLLASFPAGLVIYWAWNNILSIIQQWYITKKQGAEIHLMGNIRNKFAVVANLVNRRNQSKS